MNDTARTRTLTSLGDQFRRRPRMAMIECVCGSYSNVYGSGPEKRRAIRGEANGEPAGSCAAPTCSAVTDTSPSPAGVRKLIDRCSADLFIPAAQR